MMEPIRDIALIDIAGYPLVVYMGILTLLSLLSTAAYGYLLMKNKIKGTIWNHMRIATVTIVIALLHATLALSLFI
jgi:fumarate reductase subunit C